MRVEIEGVEQLRATLRRAEGRAVPLLSAALYAEAENIMSASREQVPVDTGALRASGTVQLPSAGPTGVEVEFGYGGAASEYAVIQHERMDYRHTVGKPKFLEGPTLEAAFGMASRLAARIGGLFSR